MTDLEKQMFLVLGKLIRDHHVIGLKAEFEAEGSRLEELWRLKELADRTGLGLTIKTGGAEALRDLHDARLIGAASVVAPLIESAFALQKYLDAIAKAYPNFDERRETDFYINIESAVAYSNVDQIINLMKTGGLKGIVLGRSDMSMSLGLTKDDVNSDPLLAITADLAKKADEAGLSLIVGGGVDRASLDFFRSLPCCILSAFETRKVIFKFPEGANGENAAVGIGLALDFELLWLRNKKVYYSLIATEDDARIAALARRR